MAKRTPEATETEPNPGPEILKAKLQGMATRVESTRAIPHRIRSVLIEFFELLIGLAALAAQRAITREIGPDGPDGKPSKEGDA